jgi:hypothetical protein
VRVACIALAVPVGIALIGVRGEHAVVTRIAHVVGVGVGLRRVGGRGAQVHRVARAVAVGVRRVATVRRAARTAIACRAVVTIDFESLPGPNGCLGTPDDAPVTEGLDLADAYAVLGVTFEVAGGAFEAVEAGPPQAGLWGTGPDVPLPSGTHAASIGPGDFRAAPLQIRTDDIPLATLSLRTVDLLESCVTADSTVRLRALGPAGDPLATHQRHGPQGPGGVILDWQVQVPGATTFVLDGTLSCGYSNAIDDVVIELGAPPGN